MQKSSPCPWEIFGDEFKISMKLDPRVQYNGSLANVHRSGVAVVILRDNGTMADRIVKGSCQNFALPKGLYTVNLYAVYSGQFIERFKV